MTSLLIRLFSQTTSLNLTTLITVISKTDSREVKTGRIVKVTVNVTLLEFKAIRSLCSTDCRLDNNYCTAHEWVRDAERTHVHGWCGKHNPSVKSVTVQPCLVGGVCACEHVWGGPFVYISRCVERDSSLHISPLVTAYALCFYTKCHLVLYFQTPGWSIASIRSFNRPQRMRVWEQ